MQAQWEFWVPHPKADPSPGSSQGAAGNPCSWNFTGGEFPKQQTQGKEGSENWRARRETFPSSHQKKKSQWEQGQLPWKKTTKKEGTSGRSKDFEAFPVPSLPSINPKENPTLFFLLYGFVLQEGGEENPNPHSQKFPLWDLFPLGKSLKNSSCAPSPIQLLPQCPTPGNFSQAPSFQFPLVQHTQILL